MLRLHYRATKEILAPTSRSASSRISGTLLTEFSTWTDSQIASIPEGDGHIDLELNALLLLPGRYSLSSG